MTVQSFDPEALKRDIQLSMTEKAANHFTKQLAQAGERAIRFFIQESGCSGYMYRIDFVSEPEANDIKIDLGHGIDFYVDSKSLAVVQGTEIDFKRDGLNEVVKFNNPNVTAECGCGESFVVEKD